MPARDLWEELHERLQALTADGSHRVTQAGERDTPCIECAGPIGYSGRWYTDGAGGLVPYCKTCAEVEFPVL